MPSKKMMRSLTDLCVQDIAENVLYHSQMFKNSSEGEKLRNDYLIFHRLFGGPLVERLFLLCEHGIGEKFPEILFFNSRPEDLGLILQENLQMCLDFIFNEQTKSILVMPCGFLRPRISTEVFSHVFMKCKGLRHLDLHHTCFDERHFLNSLPQWNSLVKLNLSQTSCTDIMIMSIWDTLPDLKELLVYFCVKITDESLLYLCKNQDSGDDICRECGCCCNLGKRLKILDIEGTRVTLIGVICALQHLQLLEYFFPPDTYRFEESTPFVLLNISAEYSDGNDKPSFRLKHLDCKHVTKADDLRRVLSLVPMLERLSFSASKDNLETLERSGMGSIHTVCTFIPDSSNLDTVEFKKFIKRFGGKLKTLILVIRRGDVRMQQLMDIWKECPKLKEFGIMGGLLRLVGANDFTFQERNFLERIQILNLDGLIKMDLSHCKKFFEILKQLKTLKIIKVSPVIALNILPKLLETTTFINLEKITIRGADFRNRPLDPFVNNQCNLKEIELSACRFGDGDLKRYMNLAKERNFHLNITFYYRHDDYLATHRCCEPPLSAG